ncbi:MAG: ATP-binding protein [Pirellulales bacterium]
MWKQMPTVKDQLRSLSNYVADLELEVDRLRRRDQYWIVEAGERLNRIAQRCRQPAVDATESLAAIATWCQELRELLEDMRDPPGFVPQLDCVAEIHLRPLVEQIFRWQQRLVGTKHTVLHLELDSEYVVWFPVRLQHILENIVSNSIRYADKEKGEARVSISFRVRPKSYEIDVADNGVGIPDEQSQVMLDLGRRASASRTDGVGVGLAVVKSLVERCCGQLVVSSDEGSGTRIQIQLPRFEMGDYVE